MPGRRRRMKRIPTARPASAAAVLRKSRVLIRARSKSGWERLQSVCVHRRIHRRQPGADRLSEDALSALCIVSVCHLSWRPRCLRLCKDRTGARAYRQLRANGSLFLQRARAAGLDVGQSIGASVIPVVVGDALTTVVLANRLLDQGLYVIPIIFRRLVRSRHDCGFSLPPRHMATQIEKAVDLTAQGIVAVTRRNRLLSMGLLEALMPRRQYRNGRPFSRRSTVAGTAMSRASCV